ncbi:MAG: HAMP domain-containing sensor histidine kinase [Ignavibacteria bacterium]|jgi:signal transduction histidine kinase
MKRRDSLLFHILVFVAAQLAWLALLGLWIYWYISNNLIFEEVDTRTAPQIDINSPSVWIFVGGIILIVAVAFVMSVMFRNLSVQLKLAKLYDNFIGNVTHELKSPLASIQLYLDTFVSRKVPAEKQKEFINSMRKDVDRLKNLIDSILDISALEQKEIAHNFYVYNFESIIKRNINRAKEQFKLHENAINLEGKADCEIVADEKAIEIVMDNLIDNAIKYSANKTLIKVKLKTQPGKAIAEISDNGAGIPSDEQKKIFKKFYRIYDKNIPNVKGTGLGLYWVREILRNHGGKISAHSNGRNKGTTFRIELPVYMHSKKHYINKLLRLTKKRERKLGTADS